MGREENAEIFRDTEKLCKSNELLRKVIRRSLAGQLLILETDDIEEDVKRDTYTEPAQVIISKKRTYEAASGYKGQKVCVLNFASASNPGGGVTNGAGAQEECLCRCSSLYFCLNVKNMWEGFYQPHRNAHNPLHNDDIIYTPDVLVFKTDTASPKLMPAADWYKVNVITCAAPNLRSKPSNTYNTGDGKQAAKITDQELLALHEKRLRRILDVAALREEEVVILGAFGCGAFLNNPEIVARAAKNVLADYKYAFKQIEFAVYCRPQDDTNYKVFERVLRKLW